MRRIEIKTYAIKMLIIYNNVYNFIYRALLSEFDKTIQRLKTNSRRVMLTKYNIVPFV
jgi:hypothetical protein